MAFNVDMSSLPMDVDMSVSVESASAGPAVPVVPVVPCVPEARSSTSSGPPAPAVGPPGPVVTAAVAGTAGSVSISLHPLVIMNISEHWTRLRAQEGSPQTGSNRTSPLSLNFTALFAYSGLIIFCSYRGAHRQTEGKEH